MAKFCGECGTKIDATTGLCPNCDTEKLKLQDGKSNFPKKRSAAGVFAIVLLVAVAVIGLICLNYFFGHSGNTDDITLYKPDAEAIVFDEETGLTYVNNIVIIYFNEGTSEQEIDSIIAAINGEIVGSIPFIDQYQVKVEGQTLGELVSLCESLEQNLCVFGAVYDIAYEVSTDVIPNDPWGKKWYTKAEKWSVDDPAGANWWVEAIDALGAWEYNDKLQNIKIGIIDNGFDLDHKDLKNVITYASEFNNEEDHGTHVAGIIGAEANNRKGITGLVWNCELYTFDWKLTEAQESSLGEEWSTANQIIGGTAAFVGKGAKIVNLSFGIAGSLKTLAWSDNILNAQGERASMALNALLTRGYDFVIVQSAGNGNKDNISVDAKNNGHFCSITPENCVTSEGISCEDIIGRIIVVGAAKNLGDQEYRQAYWSNAGDRVDICAPGYDVYSTLVGDKYDQMNGTSMAAPVVAGVAAMVWSANPELSGAEVKNIVCTSTKDIVQDDTSDKHPLTNTYNMVNARLAVETALGISSAERDVVLVLDVSGSMAGTALEETKKAAVNFIDMMLGEDASIGIVTYSSSASRLSDFSLNQNVLTTIASNMSTGGWTNIEDGLKEAYSMLRESSAKKKIVVLMSDGLPNTGKTGNTLIAYADEIKNDGIIIYTLGFFEELDNKASAQALMEEIADDGCHYEVTNADELFFFFSDVADTISGQRYIYIRVACPVDVIVTHNGETLCSSEDALSVRTDFGTLTFEENTSGDVVKILRLKEGAEYDVQIIGTGRGSMDYMIGFMDENGEYSDFRRFEDIKITEDTIIDTVAALSKTSELKIDEDGNGRYDIKLRAEENGYGEMVKRSPIVYVAPVVFIFLLVVIFIIARKRSQKNKTGMVGKAKVCRHCGAQLEGSEKFCGYCGTPVGELYDNAPFVNK